MQWNTWLMGDHVICKKFTAFSFAHNPHAIGKEMQVPGPYHFHRPIYCICLITSFFLFFIIYQMKSTQMEGISPPFNSSRAFKHRPLNLKTSFPSKILSLFIVNFSANAFKALCEFNSSLLFYIYEETEVQIC